MRSTRDFLTGLLTGVAVGILTAPRSGKDTRKLLTDEANKRSQDLKGQWEKGVDQVKHGVEQAKSQVNDYANQAKNSFNQNQNNDKQQYNDRVEGLADNAHSGINQAKDSIKVD